MKIEVIVFESPTDAQERRRHQIRRLRRLRHRRRDPRRRGAASRSTVVGSACDRGMAVIAQGWRHRQADQGPEGQEGRHLAGLDAGGLHPRAPADGGHDRQATSRRCASPSARCAIALARGDVDAYVGAEPGPGVVDLLRRRQARRVSLLHADGRPEHDLRRPCATRWPSSPDLVRQHAARCTARRASSAWPTRDVDDRDGGRQARQKREALGALGMPNVELNWQMTPEMSAPAKTYAAAHARAEADPRAARLRDLLRHRSSPTRWRRARHEPSRVGAAGPSSRAARRRRRRLAARRCLLAVLLALAPRHLGPRLQPDPAALRGRPMHGGTWPSAASTTMPIQRRLLTTLCWPRSAASMAASRWPRRRPAARPADRPHRRWCASCSIRPCRSCGRSR